ncbi:MAG: hydantoinase/oxoprolinase family protein [Alphaproteobacteria bacterium]|nr:MAG: hydantoinase/oxoprolinase family protein [Alphaproteobacteria bacterium]
MRVATDVGGTFTDLVYVSRGEIHTLKTDTTPPQFEQGIINALKQSGINGSSVDFFCHGSTVVINTLTERKGVKTGLITTRGFRDVLEIARGNTPDLFNIYYRKPKPFIRRQLRREVTERVTYKGEVLTPIAVDEIDPILDDFRRLGIEAIAVCFLHAYANPVHEMKALEHIRKQWPEVAVIASHEITREWREYERTNTTALSAYVLPIVERYLDRLENGLNAQGIATSPFIMQSNGGIATAASAKANPISLVESGPVGGMLGGVVLGRLIGESNLLLLDIGGTTAKCSLIHNGETRITTDYVLEKTPTSAGYPLKTPVIDIVEIGNGGGSIAWLDAAGSLHVGPESAGSDPGPVAYGRGGTRPTTTDANLLTGRINPDRFVNGKLSPEMPAVESAFAKLGNALGTSAQAVAHGVIQIANANMVNALKLISVNRGFDPRDFSLMAFGGGGAMHACMLARELSIPKVIVPPHAAVFSAWGMLMIDLRRDFIQTWITPLEATYWEDVGKIFATLEQEALSAFAKDGFSAEQVILRRQIDARYRGQEHTVKIAADPTTETSTIVRDRFHDAHEAEYTFCLDSPVEIVNFHVVAYGIVDKPDIKALPPAPSDSAAHAKVAKRRVAFTADDVHEADIYDRALMAPGMTFTGPAIIEEASTVTVVHAGDRVEIDRFGSIHIHMS